MEETLEMKHNVFLRWGSRLFIAFVFLLPIFFIPSQVVPFAFGKGLFLSLAVFALTILVLFSILKEGKVSLPKSTSLLGLALVLLAYIASGLASSQHELSLMGQGFEIDTAFMMLVLFLVAVLVPLLFRAKNTLFNVYISLLVSFLVVAVVSFARFFAPSFLSFGVLSGNTANVVGTWNDLGFFAGLTTVISLISLGVLHSKGFWKVLLSLSLAFGVVLLMIVNFTTLWYIIGFFSLAFFLYSHSYARHPAHQGEGHKKTVSYAPVVVLVIAVLFIFWGTSLGGKISNWLSISQIEARPSWSTTLSITKQVLKTDPVFGVGPNKFVNEWLKFKPLQVNESPFWSLDFSSGVGTVPTTFVTLGGVGILAWVIFFVLFLFEGFRAIRKLHGDAFAHYLAISSFVSALFLWLVAIFYTPSHVVYALAFIFTGIFVTNLVLEKVVGEYHFAFSSHPAKSFVGSLVTIVLIIGADTCFYIGSERALAYGTFNGAILK